MGQVWGSMSASGGFVDVFAWLGFIGAQSLFYSPIFTFRTIIKKKSIDGYDHVPYVVSVATCILWVAYGLLTSGRFMTMLTNGVGLVAELFFVVTFIVFAKGKKLKQSLFDVFITIFCVTLIIFVAILYPPPLKLEKEDSTSSLLGLAAAFVNTLMYASPLNIVRTVIKTKSVQYMPLSLTLAGLACSICWTVYAVCVGDLSIMIPNAAGDLLGFIQLFIFFLYSTSSKDRIDSKCSSPLQDNDDRTTPLLAADEEEGEEDFLHSPNNQKSTSMPGNNETPLADESSSSAVSRQQQAANTFSDLV